MDCQYRVFNIIPDFILACLLPFWRESFLIQIQFKIREMYSLEIFRSLLEILFTQTGSEIYLPSVLLKETLNSFENKYNKSVLLGTTVIQTITPNDSLPSSKCKNTIATVYRPLGFCCNLEWTNKDVISINVWEI